MKSSIAKDTIILFLITLISGAALGVVHEITLEPIAAAQTKAANETYRNVFPEAAEFTTPDDMAEKLEAANADAESWGYGKVSVDACFEAKDASGNVIGHVINATSSEGYGGDIQISIGVDNDNKLLGLGFLSISETAGLGMNATKDEWKGQFIGKDASGTIERIKTGEVGDNQFQSLSSATYTSTAVEYALNAALKFLHEYAE